jgi:hypothetical protein
MKPGFGYWIKTTSSVTLVYPSSSIMPIMPKVSGEKLAKASQFASEIQSREWISLWGDNIMVHGKLLPVGTMITAKTNTGLICGAGEVWEAGRFGMISIYKDDAETEEVEGVKEGEEITLYLGDYQVSTTIRWTKFGDVVNFNEVATGIPEFSPLPTEFALNQNYPNPFNPTTMIRYQLPKASMVTLKIFDVMGREVTTLVKEQKEAGYYEVQWNARNCASGVYFYTIRTGEYSKTLKLLLVK